MLFTIGDIKAGVSEQAPKVLLREVFLHRESRNVHRHLGLYKKSRGRLAALYDDDLNQIACPKYVWAVTAVSQGSSYFQVAGDRSAQFTAENNTPFRINGSTGNDGLYTVASVAVVGGNTRITVNEAIGDATVDGNAFLGYTPVLNYHRHIKESSAVEYLLLGTAYHILLWSQTDKTLTVKFTCTTPANVALWSFASFQDQVYAANGDDKVQVWDVHTTAANNFANVGGVNGIEINTGIYCTTAKFVTVYEGYLILGYTKEDGTWRPRRLRWCDAEDPTEWDEDAVAVGDQSHKDLMDDEGFVNGFARWASYLIVGGTKRIVRAWTVTTDTVFAFAKEAVEVGNLAPFAMVNDKFGSLYFLASDLTIRQLDSALPIYRPLEETIKGLNIAAAENARAAYYENYDLIFWAVPSGDSTTNDLLLAFNPTDQDWYIRDVPVAAFGDYTRQEDVTYGSLSYDTYSDWGAAWTSGYGGPEGSAGFPLLLGAAYDGTTTEMEMANLDLGTALTGDLVFGSHFGNYREYKRTQAPFQLVFQREQAGSAVSVYVKKDTAEAWTNLGSFSIADSDDPETVWVTVPADLRFRHLTVKISSTTHFRFAGMTIDLAPDGSR